jgi:hypothetical protein
MKARISQLHKTEAEWKKHSQWIPEAGEFVIYDPDKTHSYSRIKVGDGIRTVQDLDFFIDSAVMEIIQNLRFEGAVEGGRITDYTLTKN